MVTMKRYYPHNLTTSIRRRHAVGYIGITAYIVLLHRPAVQPTSTAAVSRSCRRIADVRTRPCSETCACAQPQRVHACAFCAWVCLPEDRRHFVVICWFCFSTTPSLTSLGMLFLLYIWLKCLRVTRAAILSLQADKAAISRTFVNRIVLAVDRRSTGKDRIYC